MVEISGLRKVELRKIRANLASIKNDAKLGPIAQQLSFVTDEFEKIYTNLTPPKPGYGEDEDRIYRQRKALLKKIRKSLLAASTNPNYQNLETVLRYTELYNKQNRKVKKINKTKTVRDVVGYTSYLAYAFKFIGITILTIIKDMVSAIAQIGTLFPPILYIFLAIKDIFDFVFKAFQFWTQLKTNKSLGGRIEELKIGLPEVLVLLSKFIAVVAEIAAVVIFIFALATLVTPIGWGVILIASTAGWISDVVMPYWDKLNEQKRCQKKIEHVLAEIDEEKSKGKQCDKQHILDLTERLTSLIRTRQSLDKEADRRFANLVWGAVGLLALALFIASAVFTAGTLPALAIGITGMVLGGLVIARGIKQYVNDYQANKALEKMAIRAKNKSQLLNENKLNIDNKVTAKATIALEGESKKNPPIIQESVLSQQNTSAHEVSQPVDSSSSISTRLQPTDKPFLTGQNDTNLAKDSNKSTVPETDDVRLRPVATDTKANTLFSTFINKFRKKRKGDKVAEFKSTHNKVTGIFKPKTDKSTMDKSTTDLNQTRKNKTDPRSNKKG